MALYVYLAWFLAGVFLANSILHIVQGICGNRFQTPFASPPGVGESSAVVNVIWGFLNFAIGGALLYIFLPQLPPPWPLCVAALIGAWVMALRRDGRAPPALIYFLCLSLWRFFLRCALSSASSPGSSRSSASCALASRSAASSASRSRRRL